MLLGVGAGGCGLPLSEVKKIRCRCEGDPVKILMSRSKKKRKCRECGQITPERTTSAVCRLCGGALRVVRDD